MALATVASGDSQSILISS